MTVNAIRRAGPHAVLAATVTAVGAAAAIFINVTLLDQASPVGNLSPRTSFPSVRAKSADHPKPNARAHAAKVHAARAQVKQATVVRSAVPQPVSKPAATAGSVQPTAANPVTVTTSASRVAGTKTPVAATGTTPTTASSLTWRRHRSRHEVELERGDD